MGKEYGFQIIDARAVAAGVAHQAKGTLYRFKPESDKGKDFGGAERDYALASVQGWTMPSSQDEGEKERPFIGENEWKGSSDYWLGRNALTDLLIETGDKKIGSVLLPDVVMSVSKQKEVVKTVLVGRKGGTVKEYVCDGDYQINIAVGVVAVDGNNKLIDRYPEMAMMKLREVLETDRALTVSSVFLDLFDINKIVVTGFSARQMTYSNRQIMEITALSDADYIIQSTDY